MTLHAEPPVVARFDEALAGLAEHAALRLATFRLCARLFADAPTVAFLAELRDGGTVTALAALAERTGSASAGALGSLAAWLETADDAAFEDARRDGVRLWVASKHLPAPPWESVYTSPDRLVLQDAARTALAAYAEAGVIFEDWRSAPADHLSLELEFAASLLARSLKEPSALEHLERFEREHFGWIPRFCADLTAAAASPLYRWLGAALSGIVTPARS